MTREYNLISADSHVIEPPDLWDKWLPRKYQDKAPKLVKDDEGGDAWQYRAGGASEPLGLVTCVGTRPEQLKWNGASYGGSIHPACFKGKERLEVLDVDGVDAEVIYPPQRAMIYFMGFKDDIDLQIAGLRAYNDWLADDFCAADRERLVPVAQMPNAGIERAVNELKRSIDKGHRGAIITAWPSGGDAISPDDDPFWALAEEARIPISIHLILVTSQTRPGNVQDKRSGVVIGASSFTTRCAGDSPGHRVGSLRSFSEVEVSGRRNRCGLGAPSARNDGRSLLAQPALDGDPVEASAQRILAAQLGGNLHYRPLGHRAARNGWDREHDVVHGFSPSWQRLALFPQNRGGTFRRSPGAAKT